MNTLPLRIKMTHETRQYLQIMDKLGIPLADAVKIYRLGIRHKNYAEKYCNEPMTDAELVIWDKLQDNIKALCSKHNLPVTIQHDPRGYTVKIFPRTGEHNTWGGKESGYGVPNS